MSLISRRILLASVRSLNALGIFFIATFVPVSLFTADLQSKRGIKANT